MNFPCTCDVLVKTVLADLSLTTHPREVKCKLCMHWETKENIHCVLDTVVLVESKQFGCISLLVLFSLTQMQYTNSGEASGSNDKFFCPACKTEMYFFSFWILACDGSVWWHGIPSSPPAKQGLIWNISAPAAISSHNSQHRVKKWLNLWGASFPLQC